MKYAGKELNDYTKSELVDILKKEVIANREQVKENGELFSRLVFINAENKNEKLYGFLYSLVFFILIIAIYFKYFK